MTLTFDRDLPSRVQGDEMVFAAADIRGSGSSIEDNLIENVPGRIYLGGLENVIVQRNVIRGASNSGINVSDVTVLVGGGGAPSHGITHPGRLDRESARPAGGAWQAGRTTTRCRARVSPERDTCAEPPRRGQRTLSKPGWKLSKDRLALDLQSTARYQPPVISCEALTEYAECTFAPHGPRAGGYAVGTVPP